MPARRRELLSRQRADRLRTAAALRHKFTICYPAMDIPRRMAVHDPEVGADSNDRRMSSVVRKDRPARVIA
jgi:hypothetical protein